MTITEFSSRFSTPNQCRAYLCRLKWKDGYQCKKCGHHTAVKGRTWYYRKCQRCHFDESCTAGTLFHSIKIPLPKAFLMTYIISVSKKGIASTELARQFGIKQTTAWYFRRKVQQAMSQNQSGLLEGVIHVDETTIGQREPGKPGKGYVRKQVIQIATEMGTDDQGEEIILRAHGRILTDHGKDQLRMGLLSMASTSAIIVTDGWKAYLAATKGLKHVAKPSEKGAHMVKLHWHIFNLKNWLRGTHHGISKKHSQMYLDEFHYRFNSKGKGGFAALETLKILMKSPRTTYKSVTREVDG